MGLTITTDQMQRKIAEQASLLVQKDLIIEAQYERINVLEAELAQAKTAPAEEPSGAAEDNPG